jgi:PAS domain S-box-containing protein
VDGTDAVTGSSGEQGPIAGVELENQTLRAENERLRRLLDSATNHAIITLNPGGRITGWNEGARAILGYGDTEIPGRSGEVFFSAERPRPRRLRD